MNLNNYVTKEFCKLVSMYVSKEQTKKVSMKLVCK